MLRAVIRPAAVKDICEHHARIALEQPFAAEKFVDAIDETMDALCTHPELGRECGFRSPALAGTRRTLVRGFRMFILFHRTVGDDLVLERVLHAARDVPGLLDHDADA